MNKLIWCAIVGGVLILLASVHGCGGVNLYGLDASGAAGAAGDTGTAGDSSDGSVRGGNVGATGGAGGAASTDGGTDVGGRPLGAGCNDDSQCSSHTCVMGNGTGMCCDHPTNECSVCIGGYATPYTDGRSCGKGDVCNGSDHQQYRCVAGACTERPVIHCALATCDKTGKQLGCPSGGGCSLPDDDPCYCLIGGTEGTISYPCP